MKLSEKVDLWWERFHGRRDVFGNIVMRYSEKKDKMVKRVFPVYRDEYKNPETREKQTFDPHVIYEPLTKAEVESHLAGRKELMIYMPRVDGKVNFFAIDYDLQHSFRSVQQTSMELTRLNIPHGIARSTSKGHHIYVFLDGEIDAFYITNFVNYLFKELGFTQKMADDYITESGKPWTNPELFPKTITISGDGTGSGIKPAMNGEAMKNNQCCWVTIKDEVIGGSGESEKQWEHFKNIPNYPVETFKTLILEDLGLDINEDLRMSEHRGAVKQIRRSDEEWKVPEDGDFFAVVNGCPALKRHWDNPNPQEIPNDARVALLSMALQCKNGLGAIREKWGDGRQVNKKIEHAIQTNQKPWCCKTMQDKFVCIAGKDPKKASGKQVNDANEEIKDHCFSKSPPRAMVNGKLVINPEDKPEEEWPWPSPIRLRMPFQSLGIKVVKEEIDKISKEDPELEAKLEGLMKKIVSLKDAKGRDEVFDYLKEKKLTTVKVLRALKKEATKEKKEEAERKLDSMDGCRTINGERYTTIEPVGYARVKTNDEGEQEFEQITNFEVILDTDTSHHDSTGKSTKYFEGKIKCAGKMYPFRIASDEYANNNKLATTIFNAVGVSAVFRSYHMDSIRTAISLFGQEKLKYIKSYENYGWDSYKVPKVYRSSSGNLTASGFVIEEGEQTIVDLSNHGLAFTKYLGLDDLTNSEFIEVGKVIKKDYLALQPDEITFPSLAHTFQAIIHNVYVPFNEAPILWIEGSTGTGKSQFCLFTQRFHGDFEKCYSLSSTVRSIDQYSMVFKDALFVVDDYKRGTSSGVVGLIQKIFDRNERGRMSQGNKGVDGITSRGLVMFNGEDTPTSEASVIARLIHLQSDERVNMDDKATEAFQRVKKASHKFSGVTSRFIQYMLNTYPNPDVVHTKFFEIHKVLRVETESRQNAPRIINSIAANYLSFELVMGFFVHENIMASGEAEELKEKHWKIMNRIKESMLQRCQEEQASNVFIEALKQCLASGKYKIEGLGDNDNPYAEVVGFTTAADKGVIYLSKDSYNAASKKIREGGNSFEHSSESIARQLASDGMLVVSEEGRNTVRRSFKGTRMLFWAVDGEKTGLSQTLKSVNLDPPKVDEGKNSIFDFDQDLDVKNL